MRYLAFTVKSVSFKSFDLQTPQGMRNCSTSVTAGHSWSTLFSSRTLPRGSSGRACPSTGSVHNDESATVWWDDQLGTIQTGFDAIVRSNGWDNDTAALQMFSHLEGDALNMTLLVPISHRLSRTELVDALSAHYGSPGRLADYRRQFERTTGTAGEDPPIFDTALETLAVKGFGDMGHTCG